MILALIPASASSRAVNNPTGPAPTTNTSVFSSLMSVAMMKIRAWLLCIQRLLRGGVELGPDLVSRREQFYPFPDFGQVQARGVRDQYQFAERKLALRADVRHFTHDFGKLRAQGRFAVATQCHSLERQQLLGHC